MEFFTHTKTGEQAFRMRESGHLLRDKQGYIVNVETADVANFKPALVPKDPFKGNIIGRLLCSQALERPVSGCDPEVFVTSGDKLIPAFKFLTDKASAKKYAPSNYAFWDGFQAEFAFSRGFGCHDEMVQQIFTMLARLDLAARKFDRNARLSPKSVVDITPEDLKDASVEHVALGCKPSENIYGIAGEPCTDGYKLPWRFAGGHLHKGSSWLTVLDNRRRAVRALDNILATWAVGAAASLDNPVRRRFYGLPGEHRSPSHGLEYRVLSNFWVVDPHLTHLVFDLARGAIYMAKEGLADFWQAEPAETIETIIGCDVKRARAILERNADMFKMVLRSANPYQNAALDKALQVGLHGLESVIKDPADIAGNWKLADGDYWSRPGYATKRWENFCGGE